VLEQYLIDFNHHMPGKVSSLSFSLASSSSHQVQSSSPVTLDSDECSFNHLNYSSTDLESDIIPLLEMNHQRDDIHVDVAHDQSIAPPSSISMSIFDSGIPFAEYEDFNLNGNAQCKTEIQGVKTNSAEDVAQIVSHASVPEFLYQLTKMLSDEHNHIIEWVSGKIEVHDPHRLESEVLNKYFRHSKYASFQRQLNYFGFRKLAGKGKMAPCSYVNENATPDLKSILMMKRKTGANTKDESSSSDKPKKTTVSKTKGAKSQLGKRNRRNSDDSESGLIAKIAVGKGVRHGLNGYLRVSASGTIQNKDLTGQQGWQKSSSNAITISTHSSNQSLNTEGEFTFLDPPQLGMGLDNNLADSESCVHNINNSSVSFNETDHLGMNRESSLVALAMIPSLSSFDHLQGEDQSEEKEYSHTLTDFPDLGYDIS
jgi:hypothetical protein